MSDDHPSAEGGTPQLPANLGDMVFAVMIRLAAEPHDDTGELFGLRVGRTVCEDHPEVESWVREHCPADRDIPKWISMEGMSQNPPWWRRANRGPPA